MRSRSWFAVVVVALFAASSVSAAEQYLAIAGSVGVFRTDARIFNPSTTKDIVIAARFLPVGNTDGSGVTARTITIPKRQMGVFDDVVSSLFQTSGLGAISLTSPDDFVSNLRIYAQGTSGTNGQFVPGLDVSTAETKGVLLQLKNVGSRGVSGYRTNYGLVNPNATTARVTLRLYDRSNVKVAEQLVTLQPFGVIAPTPVTTISGLASGVNLADGWLSYESDVKVFAYISATDNLTEDGTYVFASKDTGVSVPQPSEKTFSINARQFAFAVSPSPFRVNVGDRVTLNLTSADVLHGFQMPGFVQPVSFRAGDLRTVTFVVTGAPGNVTYFCTVSSCGSGHGDMVGTMVIAPEGARDGPIYE